MEEREIQKKSEDTGSMPWWRDAVVLFSEATGWIVIPLISALYLGQYLDEKQGSGNFYFLSLTALAFIISCVGISILGIRYMKRAEKNIKGLKRQSRHDV